MGDQFGRWASWAGEYVNNLFAYQLQYSLILTIILTVILTIFNKLSSLIRFYGNLCILVNMVQEISSGKLKNAVNLIFKLLQFTWNYL